MSTSITKTKTYRIVFAVGVCMLILILAACGPSTQAASPTIVHTTGGSSQPATTTGSTTTTTASGNTNTPVVPVTSHPSTSSGSTGTLTTVQMPPTQTSCPQPFSTGRAAVMAPLALGTHATIAYLFNTWNYSVPTFGELKRYDVQTGTKTVLVHLDHTNIAEAQVSADGQWLLFVADTIGGSELQMMRMDGQGLQTLYCGSTIHDVQWSPDQKLVMFSTNTASGSSVPYLLNMSNGDVQQEVLLPQGGAGFVARTWMTNTLVYFVSLASGPAAPENLFILDTTRGALQPASALALVLKGTAPQYCWDFDSDYSATKLVTSTCTVTFPAGSTDRGIQQGPSVVDVQSPTGSHVQNIYSSKQYAIKQVRFLGESSTHLLLTMDNQTYGAALSQDTSQNGLWTMNADGSGLTRLTTDQPAYESMLNQFTQYPWSNVSRDSSLYTVQVTDTQSKTPITRLYYGSLNGGKALSFAFAHTNSEMVQVAGWTMMS